MGSRPAETEMGSSTSGTKDGINDRANAIIFSLTSLSSISTLTSSALSPPIFRRPELDLNGNSFAGNFPVGRPLRSFHPLPRPPVRVVPAPSAASRFSTSSTSEATALPEISREGSASEEQNASEPVVDDSSSHFGFFTKTTDGDSVASSKPYVKVSDLTKLKNYNEQLRKEEFGRVTQRTCSASRQVADVTHSLQQPAGKKLEGGGVASGGLREQIPCIARAAIAVGVDGIFMEYTVGGYTGIELQYLGFTAVGMKPFTQGQSLAHLSSLEIACTEKN
ncbi:2-dehydro-3-deoxyphosphooctonate aldolase 1 [Apostasia shenzhenica]|uniref:2-dehydro-3-deoxyphosphooctonate aldolase 1 n=1 Tax=Apostasia shenzhenica TaxID=1088818 RepID=A0A2I0B911_9ASPA|nr:2-dehydro-3-deoxyphosphooctonate aldolase 1 [Apostasia shenzhenica]